MQWDRREFLKVGVTGAVATLASASAEGQLPERPRFHTPLCDLLGIEYPIIQSGMGGVGGVELAAAVSNAGGLGILAGAHLAPDEVRRRIQAVRRLTSRPFGVNLLLHPEIWPPVDPARLSARTIRAVHAALNTWRKRLGLPAASARPARRPDYVAGSIDVILDERVPIFSIGMGNPDPGLVNRFHAQGAKVIAMAATLADAQALVASGVDAVVAQGHEAGGHRSTWVKRASSEHANVGTMALVPELAAALRPPVIAAGGIATGRGIVAALALGAQGALLGTRFVATRESLARDFYKDAVVARDSDATTVTDAYSGLYARVLRNAFTAAYASVRAPVLPGFLQGVAARDIIAEADRRQDVDIYPMWAGQSVGVIHDIPAAGEVVERLVREAIAAARSLQQPLG